MLKTDISFGSLNPFISLFHFVERKQIPTTALQLVIPEKKTHHQTHTPKQHSTPQPST